MTANPSNTCVHAACSLVDSNSVSVVGNGILKQIKILESGLKLLPSAIGKRDPQNYTAQVRQPWDCGKYNRKPLTLCGAGVDGG
jgi:hypothetical protein